MNVIRKRCFRRCAQLENGPKTMEHIYQLNFQASDIFCPELEVMTEEGAYVGSRRYRTYAQIHQQIEKAGRALHALTGEQGAFIGLYAENSPEWIILFWAILRSGNQPFLVNLRQPEDTCRQLLETLHATTTVCNTGAPALTERIFTLEQLLETDTEQVVLPTFGNRLALATSGTTLKQKICIYDGDQISEQVINSASIVRENRKIIAGYKGSIRHLAFLPFYHIFGLEAVLLWFSMFGSTYIFPANMMPQTLMRTIRGHSVTHIFAVPLLWNSVEKAALREAEKSGQSKQLQRAMRISLVLQRLPMGGILAKRILREVRQRLFGDTIQFCISGGSYISAETLRFFNALGYPLCNGFGMSEIGITSVELSKKAKHRMLASIGKPFRSVEYKLSDEGHLLVGGHSTCTELLINGQSHTPDYWLDTGDLMTADNTGRYYVTGRVSDVVFGADGENLNPELAERAFHLPEVKEFCVLGDKNNEKLLLVIQLPETFTPQQYEALEKTVDATNRSLPAAYQIKKIRYTTNNLKSPTAIKISRAWLRRAINEGQVVLEKQPVLSEPAQMSEDSPLKATLRAMIAEILDIPPEAVADNAHFMNDLGGSSLDFFAFLSEIEREYGIAMEFEPENYGYSLNDFERILKDDIS